MSKSDATIVDFPRKSSSSFSKLVGRLRIKHLSLLVAIDEHRNLHRAAKAVHLAQPSASRLVHDLELAFGFSIFVRLSTGMHPTELGSEVLGFARRALHDMSRFTSDLDNRRAGCDGDLTVGTTMDVASAVLARATADIKHRRPLMSVKLVGAASAEVISRLVERQTDIAVVYFSDVAARNDVAYESIGHESLCVVVRENHPLCRGNPLSLSELQRTGWIVPPPTSPTARIVDRCLAQAGIRAPVNIVESNSIAATLNLLLNSDSVAILPESTVRGQIRAKLLARLSTPICDHEIEFGILSRRGELLSPVVMEFTQLLRRYGKCLEGALDAEAVANLPSHREEVRPAGSVVAGTGYQNRRMRPKSTDADMR
jgi:DNA-binding transcriptional LysR family regulator